MKVSTALEYPFNLLSKPLREVVERLGFKKPTEPQKRAIPSILKGENVLLIAPTGTGKTEAALLPIFDLFLKSGLSGRGVSILYITPLRALNRDILKRMVQIAEELGIKVAVRHGDTSSSERRKQALSPPDMLIITPETLQIILPAKIVKKHLKEVKWVVVDEIHELVGDKRGVQLSIALERLKELTKLDYQRVGLSATIGSIEKVKNFLQGSSREVKVIHAPMPKEVEVVVEAPEPIEDSKLAEELKLDVETLSRIKRIVELIESHRSVLIFTNTRETAELLASRLKVARPDLGIEAHHGSLSKEARVEAEAGLKSGGVKAVVCTSSLELGIDVGQVDLVVQYMSPRQVTRLTQRVGRSGHRVWEVPKGVIIAMAHDDVLESGVITSRTLKGELEDVEVHVNALDVLCHQLVGIALDKRLISLKEAYALVRKAWPYRDLNWTDFENVVNHLLHEGVLKLYGNSIKPSRIKAWKYYFENVSMIPDTKKYRVIELASRKYVGELDEEFVAVHGRPDLNFILAGRAWRLDGIGEGEVYVEESSDIAGAIPSWMGELIPVPFEVAQEVGFLRRKMVEEVEAGLEASRVLKKYPLVNDAVSTAWKTVKEQLACGVPIATDRSIVIEGLGRMVVVHACLGSKANETLGLLLSGLMSSKLGESVGYRSDPYRVLLIFSRKVEAKSIVEEVFSLKSGGMDEILSVFLKNSKLYEWRLIHVARRFGVIGRGTDTSIAGRLKKLLEGTVVEKATLEEVFIDKLDLNKVKALLNNIAEGSIEVKVFEGSFEEGVSPLAYPIIDLATPYGLVPPSKPARILLDLLKHRLMESEVKLICMYCGRWESVRKVGYLPEVLICPKCGARFIAVTWKGDVELSKVLNKHLKGLKMGEGEREALRRGQASAGLVLTYGKQAVVAMAAKGVGPQTASRILGRPHKSEDEFFLDILEAERKYAATRVFWDRDKKGSS